MRVGSLVFATQQGLGIMAKSFFDNGVITDPIIVKHGRRETQTNWYPKDTPTIGSLSVSDAIMDWVKRIDVFFAFETPFIWELFDVCKQSGVKTVLCPNHECLDQRRSVEHKPDLFLCPSMLDEVCVKINVRDARTKFLPVPLDVPWRQRTHAEVFVHNAGWGGLRGRNGTKELIDAISLIKSPIKLIIRGQGLKDMPVMRSAEGKTIIAEGSVDYNSLFTDGDVFVFPEKFNGLSLPLQEARASGMLVMGSDRFPMNTWLPGTPLIPVRDYNLNQRTFPQFCAFDEAVVDPRDIAAKIDEFYGADITEYSLDGKKWAGSMSWGVLKPQYMNVLENLVNN